MFKVCAAEQELRKALVAIEKAKEIGCEHSLAIFEVSQVGRCISDDLITYEGGVILKTHPTNPENDWGNTREEWIHWYKIVDGILTSSVFS